MDRGGKRSRSIHFHQYTVVVVLVVAASQSSHAGKERQSFPTSIIIIMNNCINSGSKWLKSICSVRKNKKGSRGRKTVGDIGESEKS